MTGLGWLLCFGAVYRLTMLVVADKITEPIRHRLIRSGHELRFVADGTTRMHAECECGDWLLDEHDVDVIEQAHDAHVAALVACGGWRYLLTCPWCASVWIGLPAVASGLAWSTGRAWQLAAGLLTASAVTGTWASRAAPD